MKPIIRTRYLVIALVLLFAAFAAATVITVRAPKSGAVARVYSAGKIVREIDLDSVSEPYEFDVEVEGGVNRIRVEHGRIRVVEADCPDRLCVNMGWRSDSAIPIACLPHRLMIRIEGGDTADADAEAR